MRYVLCLIVLCGGTGLVERLFINNEKGLDVVWGVKNAQAAICFLPDCPDKLLEFKGNANTSAQYCLNAGYAYYELGQCPAYHTTDVCPDNSRYLKCDGAQWCEDNGYNTFLGDCSIPEYVDEQCPNGLERYKQCKVDYDRACHEEDGEYVSECRDGWILDENELCSYSPLYGKCCNLCTDYPYEEDEIPQGYQTGERCQACGNVVRYQKELYDCAAEGFIQCDKGGLAGTEICWRGNEKWYRECCAPCDDFPYFEDTIPEGHLLGESCDSCDGLKYKTKVGECADGYEWVSNACVCDETCSVGNILYSDYTCSSCNVKDKTPIGVVAYANGTKRLAVNLVQKNIQWGEAGTDISGLPTIVSSSASLNDFNGRANTASIVKALGNDDNAAAYCYNYTTNGTSKSEWALPAQGELYATVWTNKSDVDIGLSRINALTIQNGWHWSSTEYSADYAWFVGSGMVESNGGKNNLHNVRCVLPFEDNGNGTANVCDGKYVYLCSGEGYLGGVGPYCGGLYERCTCDKGYVWKDGACVCDESCSVGNILYSDYTCNSCNIEGKTPIGIISYAKGSSRLVVSLTETPVEWGGYGTDISSLYNYLGSDPALTDFSGKENTTKIMEVLGNKTSIAAGYCYNYNTSGTTAGQWYLPAAGELYYSIVANRTLVNDGLTYAGGTPILQGSWRGSSTEFSELYSWDVNPIDGTVGNHHKYGTPLIRCMLSFEDNGDGTAQVCGEEYKYACLPNVATHIAGGSGFSCGGNYQSCKCDKRYVWKDGACVCDETCSVGNILYSDYTCNSCKVEGKTPIGIISYANGTKRLVINLSESVLEWGGYGLELENMTKYPSKETALQDFSGQINTTALVNALGSGTTYAAGYCHNFSTTSTTSGQWYLPALGELYASVETNFQDVNDGMQIANGETLTSGYWYWSSSNSTSKDTAWTVYPYNDVVISGNLNKLCVRCLLAFEDKGDGTGVVCGEEYKYACLPNVATHIAGGSGFSCGGNYQSCKCDKRYVWKDGACVCDETCSVGNILYSDYTCNSCKVEGKTPIGVISYASGSNRLAINLSQELKEWGGYGKDISELTNYTSESMSKNDFSGKSNTSIIVSALGDTANYAAGYCYNYATTGTSKGQWYLPAQGELYETIWTNETAVNSGLSVAGGTLIQTGYHWSSSEYSSNDAWSVYAGYGYVNYTSKTNNLGYVRCLLSFEDNGGGAGTVCDPSYKYSCTGVEYSGGEGDACDGLYQSCQCASGYEWKNGVCEQKESCDVGYILNSDMTCTATKESGKTPIGVISYASGDKLLAINLPQTSVQWGGYGTDISGLTNITSSSTAKNDFSGKGSTSKIVSVLGNNSSYAAGYCYNFMTSGTSSGDWYLPAVGELYASVWTNQSLVNSGLNAAGGTQFMPSYYYWSTSEFSDTAAWTVKPNDGLVDWSSKSAYALTLVKCVLELNVNDDNTIKICGKDYQYTCAVEGNVTGGSGSACGGLYQYCSCSSPYTWSGGACACPTSYKYTCSGTGYTGGSGTACGGKYQSCTCAQDYTWNGSACVSACDSSYKYTCVGDGYEGGDGDSCGGKYKACTCTLGNVWRDGVCQVPCIAKTCSVSCIVNSDLTCTQSKVSGKTPIGVVVSANGNDRTVMNLEDSATMLWSEQDVNVTEIPEIADTEIDKLTADWNGKNYTANWVDFYGENAAYAPGYCYNYTTAGTSKGQWYLPSVGEIMLLRKNLVDNTIGFIMAESTIYPSLSADIDGYWTSSESNYGYTAYYNENKVENSYLGKNKRLPNMDDQVAVRCTLPVVSNDNGTVSVCGADYRYACVGDGYAGGSGAACGRMYKSCQCASGYSWDGSHCARSCEVGYILNSDKTCTQNKVGGKTPIGVIAYAEGNKRLAINLPNSGGMTWGMVDYVETDVPGLTNYDTKETALTDMNGKSNTPIMTAFMNTSTYGAKYCAEFSTTGTSQGQWYLPAYGELFRGIVDNYSLVASGLSKAGGDAFMIPYVYGTSTEQSAENAWWVSPGYVGTSYRKNSNNYARCYLAMEDQGSNRVNMCSADYKYACEGTNITGGSGSTCGGMYSACTCASGYSWSNGRCKHIAPVSP